MSDMTDRLREMDEWGEELVEALLDVIDAAGHVSLQLGGRVKLGHLSDMEAAMARVRELTA